MGSALGGDDLRACGEVEVGLAHVAEPDAVACADFVMDGQVDRNGLVDAVAGSASMAGGGSPDRTVRLGGAEGGKRSGEAGGSCAAEASKRMQGLGGRGDEHVMLDAIVTVVDLRGEPGRQDGEDGADGEVVGAGKTGQIGGERFPGDGGDSSWQRRSVRGYVGNRVGHLSQVVRRVLLRRRLPVPG